jgi:hypothetical protein
MTGTLYVSFRCNNGDTVMVSKKRYEVYEDEWDMLSELQKSYGCLPWKKDKNRSWVFIADIVNTDGNCEYFVAAFRPNNQ